MFELYGMNLVTQMEFTVGFYATHAEAQRVMCKLYSNTNVIYTIV